MTFPDRIDLPRLIQALSGTRFGAYVQHFPKVESTNSLLLAAAAEGAPDGLVYLADEQTAGRGRGNHRWQSNPGEGIYLSALVRLTFPLADALLLSLATGLAVQYAVYETTGLELDIRWPNDLMVPDRQPDPDDPTAGGQQKKCGGILIETAVAPGTKAGAAASMRYAVIGIGLNVHQSAFPPELADLATSLTLADRARRDDPEDIVPIFRTPLLIAILRCLDMELRLLESRAPEGRARLLQRFTASSSWVHDRRVSVAERGGYTGTTVGLDEHGFLRVATDDGRVCTVLSGGVRAL